MERTARLPRILQRCAEIAMVAILVATLLAVGAVVIAGDSLALPVQFTPDEGAYEVTHASWGAGTIQSSDGIISYASANAASKVAAIAIALVFAGPALAITWLLRQVLVSVADGEPFVAANGSRVTAIGVTIVAWSLLVQISYWIATWTVMDGSEATGVHLEVNIRPDLSTVFLGLVVMALGAVFRHGAHLQSDADLTV